MVFSELLFQSVAPKKKKKERNLGGHERREAAVAELGLLVERLDSAERVGDLRPELVDDPVQLLECNLTKNTRWNISGLFFKKIS